MYTFVLTAALIGGGVGFDEAECAALEHDPRLVSGFVTSVGIGTYAPTSGDIIAFVSSSCTMRTVFTVGTGVPVTHVATVVRNHDGVLCILDADLPTGVRLTPVVGYLRRFLKTGGRVYIRHNRVSVSDLEDRLLTEFALEQIGKPYTPLGQLASVPRRIIHSVEATDPRLLFTEWNWHCSKITGAAHQYAGLLSQKVNVNALVPRHFMPPPEIVSPRCRWASAQEYCLWVIPLAVTGSMR